MCTSKGTGRTEGRKLNRPICTITINRRAISLSQGLYLYHEGNTSITRVISLSQGLYLYHKGNNSIARVIPLSQGLYIYHKGNTSITKVFISITRVISLSQQTHKDKRQMGREDNNSVVPGNSLICTSKRTGHPEGWKLRRSISTIVTVGITKQSGHSRLWYHMFTKFHHWRIHLQTTVVHHPLQWNTPCRTVRITRI